MSKVFLLEDVPEWREIITSHLRLAFGDKLDFTIVRSVEAAINVLRTTPPTEFALLLFDLLVPEVEDGDVGDNDMHKGLKALEAAWNAGHRNLVVLSMYGDSLRNVRAAIESRHVTIAKWLDKRKDLMVVSHWKEHFCEYLLDVAPLVARLETASPPWYAVDVVHVKFLRDLVAAVQRTLKRAGRGLPVIFLTGPTGSGKSAMMQHLPVIKEWLVGRPQAGRPRPESLVSFRNLAATSDGFNEQHRIDLFGARHWTSERGQPIYKDGDLIRATAYGGPATRPVVRTDPRRLVVDRECSGFFLGDEVLNCHPDVHAALLAVISTGIVQTVGVEAADFEVGCTLVFATNLDAVAAVQTGVARARGETTEAFHRRLGRALEMPSLAAVSFESVITLLERLAKRGVAPQAVDLLQRYHESGWLTADDLNAIADRALGARVDRSAVDDALQNRVRLHETTRPPLAPRSSVAIVDPGAGPTDDVDWSIAHAADGRSPGRDGVYPDEWPEHLGQEHLNRANALLQDIMRTNGECLGNDIDAILRNGSGALDLLALIILTQAEVRARRISARDRDHWFGLSPRNELRQKLVMYNKKFPGVFVGRKGGAVRMDDLDRWIQMLPRELMRPRS